MIVHDWFDWSNAGVGVAGLGMTLAAVWQAAGAKTAARQAVQSVRRHVAEVDFDALMRLARELHGYVEDGKMAEARLRTTDLRSDLATAIRRHEAFLGNEQGAGLREKQFDLKLVTEGLNRASGSLSPSEKIRLLKITGAILEVLAAQTGGLRSGVEKEVSNG